MMTSHNSRNSENEVWQNGIVSGDDSSLKMNPNDISHVKEKLRNELETRLGIESTVHINDDLSLLRKHSSKLSSIFDQNPHLVSALNAYEVLINRPSDVTNFNGLLQSAQAALNNEKDEMDPNVMDAAKELRALLSSGHSGAVCQAASKISSSNYSSIFESDSECSSHIDSLSGSALRVVRLMKNNEPLGATAKIGDDGSLTVARIIKGGAADRSGLIHINDRIIEVNGIRAKKSNVEAIMQGLSEYQGQLIFVLEPGEKVSSDEENEKLYIRPNFSFDPKNDTLLPCHEAGLGFHPGCILEVIQRKEEWWWQARMITNQFRNTDQIRNNKSAGLIPSSALVARREKMRLEKMEKTKQKPKKKINLSSLFTSGTKSNDSERVSYPQKTYTSVVQFGPTARCRPLVLISPRSIDKFQLRRKLIQTKHETYRIPTPSTTRPKQPNERNGLDYHFITRNEFDESIAAGAFLEYGMNKSGALYGTLLAEVDKIIQDNRIPLLCPPPQSLEKIKNKKYKAHVVFLKPVDRLNCKWDAATVKESTHMELLYSAHVDIWIEYDTDETAFRRLQEISFSLQNEPQWCNKDWVQDD